MVAPTDYLYELRRKATEEGRLLTCTWEVTTRCNLACRHCYHPDHRAAAGELDTARAMQLLGELAEAGILVLLFTGGEPFTRADFWQLLEEARRLEFAVRVLTNGTMIERQEAQRLAALAPLSVDLSIYGQRSVHEAVTGAPGSFRATCRAGRLLAQNGVRVTVKMPLMRVNLRDYQAVKEIADSWGAALVTDASIFCRLDGNRTPLEMQAGHDQLLDFLVRRAQEAGGRYQPGSNVAEPGRPLCSAGRSSLAISSAGSVLPCLTWRTELGDLRSGSFADIVAGAELARIRGLTVGDLAECSTCRLARWCVRCPGLARLETGTELGRSPTACRLAALSQELAAPTRGSGADREAVGDARP